MTIIALIGLAAIFITLTRISDRRFQLTKTPGYFFGFWKHIADSFRAHYCLWYIMAATGTWAFLGFNWDGPIQEYTQINNIFSTTFNRSMLMFGNVWHLLLGFILFFYAVKKEKPSLRLGAAAGLQAVFAVIVVVTVLKIVTGRRPPIHGEGQSLFRLELFNRTDNPWDFSFEFWNHTMQSGRFMWPSGHTSTIVAFVSAMAAYYPDKHWIKWVGYSLSALMGIIMIDGDFHWASDVWAGALIGHIIGYTVGKGFRQYSKQNS